MAPGLTPAVSLHPRRGKIGFLTAAPVMPTPPLLTSSAASPVARLCPGARLAAAPHPAICCFALVGEVGELAEILQWRSDAELAALAQDNPAEWEHLGEELADVQIYLARLADVLGWTWPPPWPTSWTKRAQIPGAPIMIARPHAPPTPAPRWTPGRLAGQRPPCGGADRRRHEHRIRHPGFSFVSGALHAKRQPG